MQSSKDVSRISNTVIKRLPRYRRYLKELMRKNVDFIRAIESHDRVYSFSD